MQPAPAASSGGGGGRLNVFVYHAHDQEGRLLAEIIRLADRDNVFQFLPVEHPRTVRRMRAFLEARVRKGALPPGVGPPFVVSGEATSDQRHHHVVHGEALASWFHGVLRGLVGRDAGGFGMTAVRNAVLAHLGPPTLQAVSVALRALQHSPASATASDGGGAEADQAQQAAEPDDTMALDPTANDGESMRRPSTMMARGAGGQAFLSSLVLPSPSSHPPPRPATLRPEDLGPRGGAAPARRCYAPARRRCPAAGRASPPAVPGRRRTRPTPPRPPPPHRRSPPPGLWWARRRCHAGADQAAEARGSW